MSREREIKMKARTNARSRTAGGISIFGGGRFMRHGVGFAVIMILWTRKVSTRQPRSPPSSQTETCSDPRDVVAANSADGTMSSFGLLQSQSTLCHGTMLQAQTSLKSSSTIYSTTVCTIVELRGRISKPCVLYAVAGKRAVYARYST